ncbi:LysR family transcriptional regulator [Pigmentiphaga litoralis]|uniref:DNA-binding transcriptional LysR family regulator n=1 Tax=Pigmentiphaga litoralis TaxID=516702 RepID=A0A7Y9IZ37_9BURK|nr:LysR family transcriptional regulator [Pigmentiphaga litoralis]NYE26330.1 DNA-binding transcriptional LysR family regulator [Pigmentiphaga litoralis]NYE85450.1 DNA-binding transcriptional LysR family regulator [Pigmentiphaga litoralis]
MDDLRRIDLNLLLALHALLAEKHVTRAAVRLHRSQPAVSHALAQLRIIFKDPLLQRRGTYMGLTPRALELVRPLDDALRGLSLLLHPRGFDPASATRRFRMAASDFGAHVILPKLMRRLRAEAPGIDLAITQGSRGAMVAQLLDGEVDLAVGVFPDVPADITLRTLFEEHFVSVADRTTLPPSGDLPLDAWLARPHVVVSMRPDADNDVEDALAAQGLRRRVALVLPHWRASTEVLVGTDLVLTVASRTLDRGPRSRNRSLKTFAPPLPLPVFAFQQAWLTQRDAEPAQVWLRNLVRECSQP